MEIFERTNELQLIPQYEHFIANFDWHYEDVPVEIGNWVLLGGFGEADLGGPVAITAVYLHEEWNGQSAYIYVEMDEQVLMKMVVGETLDEISSEVPKDVLDDVMKRTSDSE